MVRFFSGILLFICIYNSVAQNIHKRFEYKYSFKGPYLAQKDNQVPFWTHSGSAIASEDNYRITTSLRSQKGQAWVNNPLSFQWWEVEFVFRVNGGRMGADGLAFWYTQAKGIEGPVFGSSDRWNGLGLFFDSFDNDNKRNNPYVMGMVNDGTLKYNHEQDGMGQQAGGCIRDYRNKPFPVRAKITYYQNVLTVQIHNGMTKDETDFDVCFTAQNVHLPSGGYFGVTAATGGLADDHDVSKFLVYSLRSQEEMAQLIYDHDEEDKFNKEFIEYQEKTKKAKDEYIAAHPDATPRPDDDIYETSEQKELRQIFQGQGQIFEVVRQLHLKLDDIIGRQERTFAAISEKTGLPIPSQGQVTGSSGGGGNIQRHEVDSIMNQMRELTQNARDVKVFTSDILQKSNQLINRGSAQPAGGQYDFHVTLKELNEGLNIVKRDVSMANQRLGANNVKGGTCPSCVSTVMLLSVVFVQAIVLLAYFIYRDNKEAKAKKFY